MKKLELLTMQIRNIMGDMLHRGYATYLTPDDFKIGDWSETLVIDATDAPRDKRDAIWEAARAVGARIIRASYEGPTETEGGIALVANTLPFQKSGDNGGGYNSTPNMSLSLMAAGLAGSMVLEMIRSGKIKDIQIEIPVSPPEPEIEETPIYYCIYPTCVREVDGMDQYCNDHIDSEESMEMEEPF